MYYFAHELNLPSSEISLGTPSVIPTEAVPSFTLNPMESETGGKFSLECLTVLLTDSIVGDFLWSVAKLL